MEAHRIRAACTAAVLCALMGASYRTPNFLVQTADPRLAEQFAKVAEKHRAELAVAWTGKAMPEWSQPCVVTVQVGANLGAGGAASFLFDRGQVYGWRMNIQGSAERIQDSVLPHEITHMVFASHFRSPLPRWADEGAASTVEHPAERAKHKKMLTEFLQTGRGIAFNRMLAMTEYPQDVMPLYAQAHSLADYLIQQGGKQKYVAFLAEGLKENQWAAAAYRHYGIKDLGTLQSTWLVWVAQGSPPLRPPQEQPGGPSQGPMLAAATRLPRPDPNLIYRVRNEGRPSPAAGKLVPVDWPEESPVRLASLPPAAAPAKQAPRSDALSSAIQRLAAADPAGVAAASPWPAEPLRGHLSRPQPIEKPRQIILEWDRRGP